MAYEHLIAADGTIDDTLGTLVSTINEESKTKFCIDAAKALGPSQPLPDFCRRVWDYVNQNVHYQLDGLTANKQDYKEEIWTPAKTVAEGRGDCKKMAILIGSILVAGGVTPVLKHIEYEPVDGLDNDYTHIYVIVPYPDLTSYIVLDTTPETDEHGNVLTPAQFNTEVAYKTGNLYFLNQSQMEVWKMGANRTGANANTPSFMNELHGSSGQLLDSMQMGATKSSAGVTIHPHVQALISKGVPHHVAVSNVLTQKFGHYKYDAKVANIPYDQQRGSFLELVKENAGDIAAQLAGTLAKKPDALNELWHVLGGSEMELKQAVLEGAQKPAKPIPAGELAGAAIGKGFFKKLLHGAAKILHFVAPIVNTIIPGAGSVINAVADKADTIAKGLPDTTPTAPPPSPSEMPKDHEGIHSAPVGHAGSFISHPLVVLMKTALLANVVATYHLHLSTHAAHVWAGVASISCLPIFYIYKYLTNGRI